jgi:capsular polysaccharide biosynthesis protein
MEKLSKREQMALVTKADVILGVHGNGLTNEIWMKPGGAVIESEWSIPPFA